MTSSKTAILILLLAAPACARERSDTAATPPQPTAAADPATPVKDPVQTQIDEGARLYGAHCASCHGDAGQGGDAPALVGAGALPGTPPEGRKHRTAAFATVADIHGFVDKAMPPGDPSAVTADDAWAILAFDLKANGIALTAPLEAEAAAKIEIPAAGL